MPNNKIHEGHNVRRFREMRNMKQDALAAELGDDWNQKKVSLLEAKETIEPATLQQLSTVLNMPVEAFQNLDEEQAVNIIANTFNERSFENAFANNCTFNISPIEEIKKLHDEKMALYERMLKANEEMIGWLERLIKKG